MPAEEQSEQKLCTWYINRAFAPSREPSTDSLQGSRASCCAKPTDPGPGALSINCSLSVCGVVCMDSKNEGAWYRYKPSSSVFTFLRRVFKSCTNMCFGLFLRCCYSFWSCIFECEGRTDSRRARCGRHTITVRPLGRRQRWQVWWSSGMALQMQEGKAGDFLLQISGSFLPVLIACPRVT